MPRKPKHPCGYPGCPELTDRQYCPAHQKLVTSQYNRHGRTPEMKKRYNGAWPAIRRRFIAAHPLCEMCRREGRVTAAAEVHISFRCRRAAPMTRATSWRCASPAIPALRPARADAGRRSPAREPQGPLKSQNDAHAIAGPPLRAIFRDFKKGI